MANLMLERPSNKTSFDLESSMGIIHGARLRICSLLRLGLLGQVKAMGYVMSSPTAGYCEIGVVGGRDEKDAAVKYHENREVVLPL